MTTSARMKPTVAMACARGVAIILVVLYHSDTDIFLRLGASYSRHDIVFDTCRAIAVPAFLIAVGLAMSGKAQSGRRLGAEAAKYFYLYVVWTAISLVLSALLVKANLPVPKTPKEWANALILPQSPLWFPFGLSLMLLSAAVLAHTARRVRMVLAVAAGFLPLVPIHGLGRDFVILTCICTVFFYAGLLYRKEFFNLLAKNVGRTFLIATAAYLAMLLISSRLHAADVPINFAILGLTGFVAVTAFWMLQPVSLLSRPVAAIGRAALPILVLHDFWMHVAEALPIFPFLSGVGPAREALLPLYVTISAILASYGVFRVLGRVEGFFTAPDFVPAMALALGDRIRLVFDRRLAPRPKPEIPAVDGLHRR